MNDTSAEDCAEKNSVVEVMCGESPVVLGLPHTGTFLSPEILVQLTPKAQQLLDTDWHVERLYDGLLPNVTTVRAVFHRYVIDANRDPSGASLYPGQNTTELVPTTDFDGEPLWQQQPTKAEIDQRLHQFHTVYHAALQNELERVRESHGVAILYDCHSIRSEIPFLFSGRLPDFNLGTNNSTTCAAEIESAVSEICKQAQGFSSVVNGRFKGGWTTRRYGKPEQGIHAIQMELAQATYLESESAPFVYSVEKAAVLRVHLRNILRLLDQLGRNLR